MFFLSMYTFIIQCVYVDSQLKSCPKRTERIRWQPPRRNATRTDGRHERRNSGLALMLPRTNEGHHVTFLNLYILACIPIEEKSSVCLICINNYRIIILITGVLSFSAWVKYFYSILQTHHARTHARAHTRAHTRAYTPPSPPHRRTGYRYSVAPNQP